MKTSTTLLTLLSLFFVFTLSAQIPAGYYSKAEGKAEAELKSELYRIISSGYVDKGYDGLYAIYATSDITADGKVWDMYSDCTWTPGQNKCGSYKVVCDCYNREHTVPQSWFSSRRPMVSDAYQVYPTDGKVNGQRSNLPYGECEGGNTLSRGKGRAGKSTFPGYSGTVFEPVDEYKGDLARTYFYFATRYENIMKSIGGESFNGSVYPAFPSWTQELFLKWHRQDPVSQKEIVRNNAVAKHQKNRNPFIDYPELSEYVWGNRKGLPWSASQTNIGLLSPANGSMLDFGTLAYQYNTSATVDIKGVGLTQDISLAISGTDAAYFSLARTTITKQDAMAGTQLIVNYTASSIGTHTALLTISGADFAHVVLTLTATTSDDFMALPSTNLSSTGFTANWTSSAAATAYVLDVFTLSDNGEAQSQVILSEEFESGVPSHWTVDGYSDNTTLAGTIRMASGKTSCTITTPTLDLTAENNMLYVSAKQYSSDKGAPLTVTLDDQELVVWNTTSDFETYSIELPSATKMSTIAFSAAAGKRIHLDSVNVSSQAPTETALSVDGYPLTLGNVLSYQVEGLLPQTDYFYTVTPIGSSAVVSDIISVSTYITEMNDFDQNSISFSSNSEGMVLRNLPANSRVAIYNTLGRKLADIHADSSDLTIPVSHRGAYIIRVESNQLSKSYKVIY